MSFNKTSLVRQLVPKSYHFDGYNEINCPNSRDKPFFSDNVIPIGEYYLSIRLVNQNMISLEYSSICSYGKITFQPYALSLDSYISKLKTAIQEGSDFITFEIQPEYDVDSNFCSRCSEKNEDCIQLRKNLPKKVLAAVSFNTTDIKKALAMYFEISNQYSNVSNGGKNMKKKNNIFGMNFELGLSKDSNIASTLMGVAVRNPESGNWYVFDSATNTRKNLANLKMGNFPIFLLPTKTLEVSDLVKMDGKYYYVKSVNPNNTITLLGAADGVIREMLPEESIIPGMTLYTKVVAFDTKSLMDTSSKENMSGNVLAAMCMMQWANGNQDEFSLDNINDDSFNGLGSCLPVIMAMNGGNMGGIFSNSDGSLNLPMLMMLGSNSDDDSNDTMQMLVLSQLLGGGSSNPLSGIVPTTATPVEPSTENKVVCEKCGKTYPEGTNFCPACGGKTKALATTCRKCGTVLMPGALFCHNCGTKVSMDTCPNCGHAIEGNENFCPGCGTALKKQVKTKAPTVEEPSEAKTEVTPEA